MCERSIVKSNLALDSKRWPFKFEFLNKGSNPGIFSNPGFEPRGVSKTLKIFFPEQFQKINAAT
jgi:hypothetical protein